MWLLVWFFGSFLSPSESVGFEPPYLRSVCWGIYLCAIRTEPNYIYVCVYVCISDNLSVYLSVSISLFKFVSLSLIHFSNVCVCVSLCVCLSATFLSLSVFSFSLSFTLNLIHSILQTLSNSSIPSYPFSLYFSFCISFSPCIPQISNSIFHVLLPFIFFSLSLSLSPSLSLFRSSSFFAQNFCWNQICFFFMPKTFSKIGFSSTFGAFFKSKTEVILKCSSKEQIYHKWQK